MSRILLLTCLLVLAATPIRAQTPPLTPSQVAERSAQAAALVSENSRPFVLTDAGLSGPGADFLREQTARSQFVLLGESHNDYDTPRFARGLFGMLHADHGFDRLAVENDPLAMQALNEARGSLDEVAGFARRHPGHIGFPSDQDLALYQVVAEESGPGRPVLWGIDQAQGPDRYFELLRDLAPTVEIRTRVDALLTEARALTTWEGRSAFLHDDATVTPRLEALRADWAPAAGSPADDLLGALIESSVIYGYDRRAGAGERVGLYNNTEREAHFRESFLRAYRADATGGRLPKVMFKMGGMHMYRGKSPAQAFTIGNFAHEVAIFNGLEAYGINVIPVGGYATELADFPAWMQPLLPGSLPDGPVVINLNALKPWAGLFASLVPDIDRWQLRDFIHGYDALVILPNSRKSTWDLTGFPVP